MKNRFLFLCPFHLALLLFFSLPFFFSFHFLLPLFFSVQFCFSFSIFFLLPFFFFVPFLLFSFLLLFTILLCSFLLLFYSLLFTFLLFLYFLLLFAFSLLLSLLLLFLRLEFFTLRDYSKTEVSTQLPNSFRSYFSSFFGQFGLVRFGSVWSQTIVVALVSISISVIASSCDTVAPFGQKTNKNNNNIGGTLKAARK